MVSDKLPDLPGELIEEILLRSSVKSLLRFRSVSRSWYVTVSSLEFISKHTNYAMAHKKYYSEPLLFLCKSQYGDPNTKDLYVVRQGNFLVDCYKFQFHIRIDNNSTTNGFKKREKYTRILGVSNGIVCLYDDLCPYRSRFYIMWNVAIRKYVILPPPSVSPTTTGWYKVALGFIFDDKTNDYKLVRIVNCPPVVVEIFELNKNAWKVIDSTLKHCPSSEAVSLNGALHWIGGKETDNSPWPMILFDVKDEVFKEINKLPSCLDNIPSCSLGLMVLGGSLCVKNSNCNMGTCDIWIMKEYGVSESWTKQFVLQRKLGTVTGLTRDEKRLLLSNSKGDLVEYDPETDTTSFVVQLYPDFPYFSSDHYVETLTLLNGSSQNDLSLSRFDTQVKIE